VLATELEHLRHERHPIQTSIGIESAQNLFAAPHFDSFAGAKLKLTIRADPPKDNTCKRS